MNTIEALQYLKDNPGSVVSIIEEERRIEMKLNKEMFDWNKCTFVDFTLCYNNGRIEKIDFADWIQLDNEWEVSKEVRYYVKFKALDNLESLVNDEKYLNYGYNTYFISSLDEFNGYKTKFTRDEIEEFGIEHPEVRREDLEFIEVVE